jgi:SAM-dependent methyltransferase
VDSRAADTQEAFWEAAGAAGYHSLFRSERVASHILGRRWHHALEVAQEIALDESAAVLELGCGEGEFATKVLGPRFRRVDAIDGSRAAIDRARARPNPGHVLFQVGDLRAHEFVDGAAWSGAFIVGFLHHVKPWAASIVARLSRVAPRVVVVEPNGDSPIRPLIERLPSCRQARCESFRLRELLSMFREAGYELRAHRTVSLPLGFTPDALIPAMARLERWVEARPSLGRVCSTRVLGFTRRP